MKRILYYIIALVVIGVSIVSIWAYRKYLKPAPEEFLYFDVTMGDIQEKVQTRGDVVAEKEFELEFLFDAPVKSVQVREGQRVSKGQILMELDAKSFQIQAEQLKAVIAERKAGLSKQKAGAIAEDLRVSESKLSSAEIAMNEAYKGLADKIRSAYVSSEDALHAKVDQLFNSPRSASPVLIIPADNEDKNKVNSGRLEIEGVMNKWTADLSAIVSDSDLLQYSANEKKYISLISDFQNKLSPLVNALTPSIELSQTKIDSYKTDLSSAKSAISSSMAELILAEEKFNLAKANVELYKNELSLKSAPVRVEDIQIAEARISEAESQLNAVNENIRRSTLYAPTDGKISKIHYEVGEIARAGNSVISMVTTGYKLQTDVSELDIGKVRDSDGSGVLVELDAFPNKIFNGRVVSIDPKEVIKTEDKYYRVNIVFDAEGADIRSGMSADTTILAQVKKDVLLLSDLAIYTDGKNKYAKVLLPGLDTALSEDSLARVDIKTGVTDGSFFEITEGLKEGQIAVVTPE